jgi:predicted secreted protein
MGIKVGIGGDVKIDNVSVAFLNEWKLEVAGEVLNFTKFKDTDKRQSVGIKSAKGSCEGNFTTVLGTDPKSGVVGGIMMETTSTSMTDEPTTANQAKTVYTITNTVKQFISLDTADVPTVKYNAVAVSTADYVINYAKGTITFAISPGNAAVTISGKYITMALLPGFTKFSLDTLVKPFDNTVWVASSDPTYGWKRVIGTIGEWSAKANGFLMDQDIIDQVALAISIPKHFAFVMDQTNLSSLIYGQGTMESCDLDHNADNVLTQDLSIISTSELYRTEENALWTAYQARDVVSLSLIPAIGDSIIGDALITKLNISSELTSKCTFSFDFEIDGPLTITIV